MASTNFCDDPVGGWTAVLDKAATISDSPQAIHVDQGFAPYYGVWKKA